MRSTVTGSIDDKKMSSYLALVSVPEVHLRSVVGETRGKSSLKWTVS